MRRSDLMPIAAVGNTQKMLGISLEELQANLMTLMQQMADRDASEQVWKSYRTWEGAPLGKFRRQYTGCRGASSSGRPPRRS